MRAARRSLPEPVRERLQRLAGRRHDGDGVIVITAARFRSQLRNREDARERLVALIRQAAAAAGAAPQDQAAARVEGAAPGGQAPSLRGQVAAARQDADD